jgi:predicted HAD superfamily Cof-like phosphohydrolase
VKVICTSECFDKQGIAICTHRQERWAEEADAAPVPEFNYTFSGRLKGDPASYPFAMNEDVPYQSHLDLVRAFHEAFGVPCAPVPSIPPHDVEVLRRKLIREEHEEWRDASHEQNIVQIADALADMLYVIHGTALAYGIPLDEVFAEVHRSNMTKLGADGKPVRREDGKVMKGPGYEPPRIAEILRAVGLGKDEAEPIAR